MKFILEIELGNDAMQTPRDLENALYFVQYRLRQTKLVLPIVGRDEILETKIKDSNGNVVGFFKVE